MEIPNYEKQIADALQEPALEDSLRTLRKQSALVDALTALRLRRGLTQQEMATALGVNKSTLSRFESSLDDDLRLGMLVRYMSLLDMNTTIRFHPSHRSSATRLRTLLTSMEAQVEELCDFARTSSDPELHHSILRFIRDLQGVRRATDPRGTSPARRNGNRTREERMIEIRGRSTNRRRKSKVMLPETVALRVVVEEEGLGE